MMKVKTHTLRLVLRCERARRRGRVSFRVSRGSSAEGKERRTLDGVDDLVEVGPLLPAHERVLMVHDVRQAVLEHVDRPGVGVERPGVGDLLDAARAGGDDVELRGVRVGRPEAEGVAVRERNHELEACERRARRVSGSVATREVRAGGERDAPRALQSTMSWSMSSRIVSSYAPTALGSTARERSG